jgi:hypothetical protein
MERLKTEDLVVIGIIAYGILTSKVLTTRAEVSELSPQEQQKVKQSLEWQKPVTEPPKTEVLTPTRIALVKKDDGTYVCVYLYDTTSTLGVVVKTYPVSDTDMNKCLDDAYYQYVYDVYGVSRELVGTFSLIKTDNLYVCAKEPTTVVGTKIAVGLTEEECMKRATELSGVKPQQPTVTTTPSTTTAVQTVSQPISTTQPARVQIPQNYYQVLQQASQNEACFDQCRAMNSQNMGYCTQQCCTPTSWGGYACEVDCYENCRSWVIKYHLECISRCAT